MGMIACGLTGVLISGAVMIGDSGSISEFGAWLAAHRSWERSFDAVYESRAGGQIDVRRVVVDGRGGGWFIVQPTTCGHEPGKGHFSSVATGDPSRLEYRSTRTSELVLRAFAPTRLAGELFKQPDRIKSAKRLGDGWEIVVPLPHGQLTLDDGLFPSELVYFDTTLRFDLQGRLTMSQRSGSDDRTDYAYPDSPAGMIAVTVMGGKDTGTMRLKSAASLETPDPSMFRLESVARIAKEAGIRPLKPYKELPLRVPSHAEQQASAAAEHTSFWTGWPYYAAGGTLIILAMVAWWRQR
ncbi:MAG: hypothetical protein KIT68_08775 [Phycisphaeraceae bacterium]|nr:hypothetical protein [Phycisphaeraceae bacterium]